MKKEVVHWAAGIFREARCRLKLERSLHPIAGEIVGARLMGRLGIGAPDPEKIKVVNGDFAPAQQNGSVIWKSFRGLPGLLRLKAGDENAVIGIPKLVGCISLVALREGFGIAAPKPEWTIPSPSLMSSIFWTVAHAYALDELRGTQLLSDVIDVVPDDVLLQRVCSFLPWGRDSMPPGFFSDFTPPQDWSAVRKAIAWNSDQMLAIHAARLFLACSAAHAGNILIDANAKLYSVDHEFSQRTDGSEITMLFANVKAGTRAAASLGAVGRLEESDVRALFEDLPGEVSWPLGSREATVEYFLERAVLWRRLLAS